LRLVVVGEREVRNDVLVFLRLVCDLVGRHSEQGMRSEIRRDLQVDYGVNSEVQDVGHDVSIGASHRVLSKGLLVVVSI
jgi:hypothetical protein